MQTVALTPELRSTRIGFGCAGLMRDPSRQRRQAVLAAAFEQGIRHFDVARMYGLGVAERELGNFAKGRRDQLVIVTKFGIEASSAPAGLARLQGPARRLLARYPALRQHVKRRSQTLHTGGRYDPVSARRSLETSLRELGSDHVDVLLLHDPPPDHTVELDELGAYLESARAGGYIGAWGVAGERSESAELERVLPGSTILQVRSDVFSRTSEEGSSDLRGGRRGGLITFGVLSNSLDRIVAHVNGCTERRARWREQVGVDCSDPQRVAELLLRHALSVNPDGVVLYSTGKPSRMDGLGALVAASAGEAASAIERLVREELPLPATAG